MLFCVNDYAYLRLTSEQTLSNYTVLSNYPYFFI